MLKQMRKHKAVHMQAHATSVERMHSHTHSAESEALMRTDMNSSAIAVAVVVARYCRRRRRH